MKESPLFWPVILKKDHLLVLDETKIPKRTYIKVRGYKHVVQLIKEMRVRAFGQLLIVFYVFALELQRMKGKSQQRIIERLGSIKKALDTSRPTFPFAQVTSLILSWAHEIANGNRSLVFELQGRVLGFLESIRKQRYAQAREAAALIKNNDVILTHCNVSGELPLIAQLCKEQKKRIAFFATETRPYFQGLRLTAWELRNAGFDVTVIVDSAVAKVMQEGKIDKVIVGADCCAHNGDIANKIGTYTIALLAKKFKIPFYVLTPPVSKYKSGDDIPIEIRSEKELFEYGGIRIVPKGIKGYYPAFDVTPKELITKHIRLQ